MEGPNPQLAATQTIRIGGESFVVTPKACGQGTAPPKQQKKVLRWIEGVYMSLTRACNLLLTGILSFVKRPCRHSRHPKEE